MGLEIVAKILFNNIYYYKKSILKKKITNFYTIKCLCKQKINDSIIIIIIAVYRIAECTQYCAKYIVHVSFHSELMKKL